jgi:hypothetical protein
MEGIMSLADVTVLGFILAGFGVFIVTLAWVSRPPRRVEKALPRPIGPTRRGQTGTYSISHR